MNNKKQMPAFLVLTIICLVAALALAATNAVTAGPIEEHKAAARAANFSSVLSATAYEEVERDAKDGVVLVEAWRKGTIVDALSGATVTSEAVIEAVNAAVKAEDLTASAKGFQSDVTVTVTLDEAGAVSALTIDSASETQGFGTRCGQDEGFISQFVGKKAPFVRTEGKIGYCVSASAEGYGGAVAVTLGVNMENEIVGAKIGDNNFRETGTIGGKWLAEDKLEQFIGIDLVNGGALDTIAGATVTSDAVKDAANKGADALRAYLGIESETPVFGEPKPIEYAASVAAGNYSVTGDGYQSEVKVNFTVDENSTITALTMDTSGETQGFGTRCAQDADFVNQFIGKAVPVMEFDVLSGATITSNAVVKTINSIAVVGAEVPAVEASAEVPAVEETPVADALTAAAPGFMGADVGVTITLNEDGTIATITIDNSKQVPPVCDMVNTEAFLGQFIGKKGPFTADVVAGATFTSQGVIDALNSLFAEEEAADNQKTAAAPGFMGADVGVTITLNEDGTIATITIDNSKQVPPVCDMVNTEAFLGQFIGKKGPFTADVVAGATFTSQGVIDALNSLFPAGDPVVVVEEVPAVEETHVEEETPVVEETPAVDEVPVVAGLVATVPAFANQDITVTVSFDENGNVATLVVDAATQTPGLGLKCAEAEFVNQFVGQAGPFVLGENVDAVSYATITSQAVVDAVNSFIPTQDMSVAEEVAKELVATVPAFANQDITVTVSFDENGKVATLVVDAATQTPGLGLKCAEAEFVNQFVGQAGPFVLGENVDAVSYATITSQAVVDAVNSFIPTQDMSVAEEVAKELVATVPAFANQDITVTVSFDENGNVATLVVDAATQTPGLGLKCAEAEFVNQFVGQAGPFVLGENVDAVSYATITSQAVVDAVNSLLGK